MKEIGKLIELLNEYNEGGHWRDENFDANKLLVISKKYGFIKWLVENGKIDESKIFCDQGLYYSLLCKLAISDTPIEDLLLYLK